MTSIRKRPDSAIQEAVSRVASAHPHGLSQVRLLKLLWLAELRHLEQFGDRLTPAGWWRWDYGPYSKDVINSVRKDTRHFKVSLDDEVATVGGRIILAKAPVEGTTLTKQALEILDDIIDMYSSYSTQELLAEVYSDPFFEETAYGDDFDFQRLDSYRKKVPDSQARRLLELETHPVENISALFG